MPRHGRVPDRDGRTESQADRRDEPDLRWRAGRDRLTFVDGDRATRSAAYHARTPGYSVIVIVRPSNEGGLDGVVVEGKRRTFARADARSLLRRVLSGEPRQDALDDIAKPAGACAWDTMTDTRQGTEALDAYVDDLLARHSGSVTAPADPSLFSDDPVPSGVSLEFTIDRTSAPTPVTPIRPDGSGAFWFSSPVEAEKPVSLFDGCSINLHYWAFASAQDSVDITLMLIDTLSDVSVDYPMLAALAGGPTVRHIRDRSAIGCQTP